MIVIDSSAAIELALARPNSKSIADTLKKAKVILAPSLYLYEIANVMWKYRCFEPFSADLARQILINCSELVNEFIPASSLFEEANELACKINHPIYDASYLLVCMRRQADLVTGDQCLKKAAEKLGIVCR